MILRSRGILRTLVETIVALGAVLLIWVGFLWAFDVNSYVGKGPVEVLTYLFGLPASAENRATVFGQLGETLADAALGFVVGLAAALVIGAVFFLSRGVESTLMPLAMLLRSVPLVAMAPIIILLFGRDRLGVAVIGGIVVLFPALVNIVFGLRSAPAQAVDLVRVYGGGRLRVLFLVALPSALPSIFAAIRISVPGALIGALIAEWLATGGGLGHGILSAVAGTRFSEVWTSVVLVTGTSILLYNIVALIESVVVRRRGA